jgi:DnaJ family protein A protein 2
MSNHFTNLFNGMFGGMGMPQSHNNVQVNSNGVRMCKAPPKEFQVKVSLEDIYNGKTISQSVKQINKCMECNGIGTVNPVDIIVCNICSGKGKIMKVNRMGNMIQQILQDCYKCGGRGKSIKPGAECLKCHGTKSIEVVKLLEFYMKPGSCTGDKYILKGDGDWNPGFSDQGDFIFVIVETPSLPQQNTSEKFIREGSNIILNKNISLVDALCGITFIIKQLDGRYLKISYNEIINPNEVMKIVGEGLPIKNNQYEKGDMIIRFNVMFPNKLSNERKAYIKKILPKHHKQIWDTDMEIEDGNLDILDGEEIEEKTLIPMEDNTRTASNEEFYKNIHDLNNGNNNDFGDELEDDLYDDNYREGFKGSQDVQCSQQ